MPKVEPQWVAAEEQRAREAIREWNRRVSREIEEVQNMAVLRGILQAHGYEHEYREAHPLRLEQNQD